MAFNSLKNFLGIKKEQKIEEPKKIIKKSLSVKKIKKPNISVTKFFLSILKNFFSFPVLDCIKPKSFKNGILKIVCKKEYMLSLNDRKDFFIKKINKHFGELTIKDIIFLNE